ncbi:ACP S-malonyltransferase [Halobacteriovorax sp. DA5]|uniref:ACP S-malonyltransferase n=1 Tax=unclassified Halobacteriovorax TaxID=2639665 RepID=UPI000CD2C969|nr:ACP S-malonyltransferase [Halobacteriovorax sp. DA5]POB13984.1 [acyl-carrier-protein] S-malonyltransferase [Halobacteriovorax sp. DA5]
MKKVVLIFPGQGSQYVGMGKSLEGHPSFELLEEANGALGYNLSKIMLEGPEEELTLTQNTQPAILTYSIGLFQKAKEILDAAGVEVSCVLGHSVGEYPALVAAGALSFEDALRAVHNRGKYMQEAVPAGMGKMYAVMRVPADIVEKACKEASTEGNEVMPANFNEPGQIVISGHADACDKAVSWISENFSEPHKTVELKVSAPFHSSLMKPARENMAAFFNDVTFNKTTIPYIANIDAKKYQIGTDGEVVKENLIKQIDGSVLWTQSFASLDDDTLCVEVGPGRVLMGLARKINRNIKVISLDKDGAFDELREALNS